MAELKLPDTVDYMKVWANNRMRRMRSMLARSGAKNSGNLAQSITLSKVTGKGGVYIVSFEMAGYAHFVDQGVRGVGGKSDITGNNMPNRNSTSEFKYKGKKPPFKEIESWVKTKTGRSGNDWFKTMNIRESIYRSGTKPTNFLQKTLFDQKEIDSLAEEIAKRAKDDIINIIVKK